MGEFASKGLANGVGIPALVLGSLGFLQSGGLGGGLGGILGGGSTQAAMMANALGQNAMAEKDATIARLMSEKYADKVGVEVYAQSRRENQDLGDRILGNWIKPIAQESAANRERLATIEAKMQCADEQTKLREQLIEQRFATAQSEMNRRVDDVANKAACGISANAAGIAALKHVVDGITAIHVPTSVICPEVMPRWNAFQVPEAAAPATQPVTGTVNVGA